MKISKSKQELARIISENGGWRDGAKFAAQDGDGTGSVDFFKSKPQCDKDDKYWKGEYDYQNRIKYADVTIKNFHQTILSSAEYFHLHPAPDADGWIKWKGGECPVKEGVLVDAKDKDGSVHLGVRALVDNDVADVFWEYTHTSDCNKIVAYRLHNPEQDKPEFCESVTRSIPEPESKPTIEQLAADYRNSKEYADRKQEEADVAKSDLAIKWGRLVAAGKANGLVLSVDDAEPEAVITDWRDLQVGDEMECVKPAGGDVVTGSVGTIIEIDKLIVTLDFTEQKRYCYCKSHFERGDIKFIRRP